MPLVGRRGLENSPCDRKGDAALIKLAFVLVMVLSVLAGRAPAALAEPAAAACAAEQGLGVARVVEIDTSTGPLFGSLTKFAKQTSPLGPKEVVLTFDDGPAPGITKAVLDTLDQFCTKATFFQVGRMALAYPDLTKAVLARGHTVGAHTWSHPLALSRLKPDQARDEIERGFTAISLAAGQPIAPFFRFPGLGDTSALLGHLQKRGIGTFTVDVVSDDSFVSDPAKLARLTLQRVAAHQGGIILFHDIKPQTARALPVILAELKAQGYRVVHMRSKHALVADETFMAELRPMLAKAELIRAKTGLFTPPRGDGEPIGDVPVTEVTPEAKSFVVAARQPAASAAAQAPKKTKTEATAKSSGGAWSTSVVRPTMP